MCDIWIDFPQLTDYVIADTTNASKYKQSAVLILFHHGPAERIEIRVELREALTTEPSIVNINTIWELLSLWLTTHDAWLQNLCYGILKLKTSVPTRQHINLTKSNSNSIQHLTYYNQNKLHTRRFLLNDADILSLCWKPLLHLWRDNIARRLHPGKHREWTFA